MIVWEEDPLAGVLEDKLNHMAENTVIDNGMRSKISDPDIRSSMFNNDDQISKRRCIRSRFVRFAIQNNHVVLPSEVHRLVQNILKVGEYYVKRIIKTDSVYIRFSVLRSVPEDLIKEAISRLRICLEAKVTKLKWQNNSGIKRIPKERLEETTILTFNINKLGNKLEELSLKLNQFRPTIICLQETGLVEGPRDIHINGYRTEESKAKDGGLGMLIGVRKDCNLAIKILEKNENLILFSVHNRDMQLIIANIYQNNKDPMRSKTRDDIIRILNKFKDQPVVVTGDWNQTPAEVMKRLESSKVLAYAARAPKKGTRTKANLRRTTKVIDFGISNQDDLIISQTAKRHWYMSDHMPIMLKVKNKHKTRSFDRKVIFDRKLLNNKKVIKEILTIRVDDQSTAQEAVDQFSNTLKNKLEKLKVIREVKVIDKSQFISTKIKKLIISKNESAKLTRMNILSMEEFKRAKAAVKKAVKQFRRNRYLRFIKRGIDVLRSNDSRNAWKWLKSHAGIGKRSKLPNQVLDRSSGQLVEETKSKLEVWAKHFESLCQNPDRSDHIDQIVSIKDPISNITDRDISWDEIKYELKCTRNNKAAGDDKIPSEVYKISLIKEDSDFSKSLLKIFNKVINEGTFPTQWESCVVVPVFKKGDAHDTNNYRGIALINTLMKLFSKVLARRLQTACNRYPLLKKEQAGFMSSGECVMQAATLLEICQRRNFKGQDTVLCFLDLKKAYDLVPHDKLINKMIKKQLGTKLINFVRSMYLNTKMKVKLGDDLSDSFEYKRGVRQGCPTSPLLFNFYIDDLLDHIEPINVEGLAQGFKGLMFADDTVIAAEDFNDLRNKLDQIQRWMAENDMEVNPSKCGVMLIRGNDSTEIQSISYKSEIIPNVDSYVYLGVDFNKDLDLNTMSKFRVQKGIEKSKALTPTLRNHLVPLEYKRMLLNSILLPTLSYGTEIFGMCEKRTQNLKKVIDFSLSQILNTKNFARNRAYEEFDLKSVHVRAAINRTRALQKWKSSEFTINSLISTSSDFKSRKSTWSKGTKLWLKRWKIDPNNPVDTGKQLVYDNYSQRIEKRDRTVAYQLNKTYKIKSGKKIRRLEINKLLKPLGVYQLMRIRTGTFSYTNSLVYKGYIKPEYKNKCLCCKSETIEDIEHLLLKCSAFAQERSEYLGPILSQTNKLEIGKNIKKVISFVLGGDCPASGKMHAETIVKTIDYLSAIAPKRSRIIRDL